MKLYTSPGACSTADHIVLEWIGKPYTTEIVNSKQRATPEYRKLNPAGAVPVLDDNGWILTQNAAIMRYLVTLHPESGLGGDGTPKGDAEVNRWLSFFNADVHPTFHPLFGSTAFLNDPAAIEKTKENARTKLRGYFERANTQLHGRDWITGQRSVVDAYFYITLRWAKAMGIDFSGLDNLPKFVARMEADAGVQRVLKAEGLA